MLEPLLADLPGHAGSPSSNIITFFVNAFVITFIVEHHKVNVCTVLHTSHRYPLPLGPLEAATVRENKGYREQVNQ